MSNNLHFHQGKELAFKSRATGFYLTTEKIQAQRDMGEEFIWPWEGKLYFSFITNMEDSWLL